MENSTPLPQTLPALLRESVCIVLLKPDGGGYSVQYSQREQDSFEDYGLIVEDEQQAIEIALQLRQWEAKRKYLKKLFGQLAAINIRPANVLAALAEEFGERTSTVLSDEAHEVNGYDNDSLAVIPEKPTRQ